MRALHADGLIRTEPGVGNFVTKPEERKEIGAPQEAHAVTLRWSAIIQWY
jgi:DNA-binding GntR family transcriptional regulator